MPYSTPLIFSTLINNMAWAIGLEITLAILGLLDLAIPTLGHHALLGDQLSGGAVRPLVVGADANCAGDFSLYLPLLALGQHQ
jgi:hypothetical protein